MDERQINMSSRIGRITITDDKRKLQIDRVCKLLNSTYWAEARSEEVIEKSIEHSICFGVYDGGNQIGFARCVTDYATVYWLADVVIDEDYRGLGLGKALIAEIVNHHSLKGCSGILATLDAHGFYSKFGFEVIQDTFMRRIQD